MAYDPDRATARDRVRAVAGDTADPATLTGGEDAYDAILAAEPTEHAAAVRACRELRAQLAHDPSSVSLPGLGVAWPDRDRYLADVVAGRIGTGLPGDPLNTASSRPTPYAYIRAAKFTAGME